MSNQIFKKLGVIVITSAFSAVHVTASLFTEVTGLSSGAQSSLVAHYDARSGVDTTGTVVNSWTPVDGNGSALPGKIVAATAIGAGSPNLISYNGSNRLLFDDSDLGSNGRYLSGLLGNTASTEFTVVWLGHYKNNAPFAASGTYAYNIGPNNISHQRDDFEGGYRVEMYNGTTYGGADIEALDNTDTVWSTVITSSSHAAYANGADLSLEGNPSNSVVANATINIGAFAASGYDFVGEMSHLLIFDTALSDVDRALIEDWLSLQREVPSSAPLEIAVSGDTAELTWDGEGHLLSSNDLSEWRLEPEVTSPFAWTMEKEQEYFRLAETFTSVPSGVVFRTQISTYTSRQVEYHLDTGDLYFLGEQTHGLDYYDASQDDFWWCFMNSGDTGSGLLEFLMDNNINAADMKSAAVSGGWASYTGSNYSFLTFQPLASHSTYLNGEAPSSPGGLETTEAYTDDYTLIPSTNLFFTLYRNSNSGLAYIGLGGPSLNAVSSTLPPGDGTASHDNGVRFDIAFKTNVPLTDEKKLELMNAFNPVKPLYDDSFEPYYLVHPPGL